jgi:hypothetical protein
MPEKEMRVRAILDDQASVGLASLSSAIGTVGINIALLARHFGKGNEAMMVMFTLLFTIGHTARALGAIFRILTSETIAQTLANWGLATSFAGIKAALGDPTALVALAAVAAAAAGITYVAMGGLSSKSGGGGTPAINQEPGMQIIMNNPKIGRGAYEEMQEYGQFYRNQQKPFTGGAPR